MGKSDTNKSRRDFLKLTAIGTAAVGLTPVSGIFAAKGTHEANEPENSFLKPLNFPMGKSVMGLACDPLNIVRIGFIGLGMRGSGSIQRLLQIEGTKINAICDLVTKNVKDANKRIVASGQSPAEEYLGEEDWKKVCERDDIDLIYTCTPWTLHTPIAVYAMKHGKHIATEVPAALTIKECWELVDTAEATQRHCMMLENCCYDFFELATLNMARNGIFGEVLHAEGAYLHDLRFLKFAKDGKGGYYHQWRLQYSKAHTGNPYPTHGLGPLAQIMGINRGDRFEYLSSMSTKQVGMNLYANEKFGPNSPENSIPYRLGDMNTTIIHTINGKTMLIQHNTTNPRPYSRIHMISGTKGMAVKYPQPGIALEPNSDEFLKKEDFDAIMNKYEHPLAKQIGEKAKQVGGHGGMDFIMDYRLIYCLRKGLPLDQDVYDAATWSSLVQLSETSVLNKSKSIEVPDFTRGAWKTAAPLAVVSID